jgi:hypothetical protein
MKWLMQVLLGPGIWAVGFSAVYALHGLGCARSWPGVEVFAGLSLHLLAMGAAWAATLVANVLLLLALRRNDDETRAERLPVMGAWIGLAATVFTLFPVVVTSSCWP